jgi:hypothetical protein
LKNFPWTSTEQTKHFASPPSSHGHHQSPQDIVKPSVLQLVPIPVEEYQRLKKAEEERDKYHTLYENALKERACSNKWRNREFESTYWS